jgi:tetratricopeptide (TPR) repeat protein
MHLRPSGKPETLQPRIALYFAKSPPTLRPTAIVLSALDLDIPAGTANYVSERAYRLPVAASVLAICPHAHYLGKDLHAWATLPDGRDVPLIRLFPWDFNWQDSYRYLEPVALPAGALVHMRYTYDNTAENALNPSAPPRRVVYGENASDEMGELLLQLLPAKTEERAVLERDFAKYMERENLTYLRGLLLRSPNDVRLRYSVALALERLDEFSPALELLRGLVTERPRDSMTRTVYGRVLVRSGDLELASDELARARTDLTKDPRTRAALVAALTLLGDAQRARGDEPAAMQSFARALELDPADATARQRIQR